MGTPSRSRREFLAGVGRGTLVAALGSSVAIDLGLASRADAAGEDDRLTFGSLEPLVALLEETPAERLTALLVEKIRGGMELRDLVAAGALANARAFGGEDYVGYHTMMAMAPALAMSGEINGPRAALPVLKVLHRNARRLHESKKNTPEAETLRTPPTPATLATDRSTGEQLRERVRARDLRGAEAVLIAASDCCADPEVELEAVLAAVCDNTEVHRVVLPYRAFELSKVVGPEHAQTLLRQSVRYCVVSERDWRHDAEIDRPRTLLPALLERLDLANGLGRRAADDAWVDHLARAIFDATPDAAAEAAMIALSEGHEPDAVGEAIALATNQLVLRDAGRPAEQAQPGKPAGSVHGDSIGVHACDSANAWRRLARVGSARNRAACLILGAYQAALDRTNRGGDFAHWTPRPSPEALSAVRETRPDALLGELDSAVRANDQDRACAVAARLAEASPDPDAAFGRLLAFAISEDGALHAEKYYRTAREEFAETRPAFRARQLVALARVTASQYGQPAPGVEEARSLLGA